MIRPRIVVDLMGSDRGPEEIVRGVVLAIERGLDAELLLVGTPNLWDDPPAAIAGEIRAFKWSTVQFAKCSVGQGLRDRDSSVAVSAQAVASGAWGGFYSCGNTQNAVFWATSQRGIGMLDGFNKAPLVLVVPNRRVGRTILLDAGANVDCSDEDLVRFAKLGYAFAKVALGVQRPTIRLLANGTEPYKGDEVIRKAAKLLEVELHPLFAGLTEGSKVLRGDSHVVVADGLLGNVALKLMEDTAGFLAEEMRDAFRANWWTKLIGALARPILRPVRDRLDPSKYGSMPLLGTQRLVMIGHGAADAEAVSAGLVNTARYLRIDLVNLMKIQLGLK